MNKAMNSYLLRIFNFYKDYKDKYGPASIVLFPAHVLLKIIKKLLLFATIIIEYALSIFAKNRNYTVNYLKSITNLQNEAALLKTLQKKNRFLINCQDSSILDLYHNLFPQQVQEHIDQAEMACNHIFDLLGSGNKKLSKQETSYQPIDWHVDFKSGYRWNENTFFRFIRYGNVRGADVIVPWELSRFQGRMALAQAYALTHDVKYTLEFQAQVNDWIDNNRVDYGVNWNCSMEIAIRAANWLVIKELFETSYTFSEQFLTKFYGSLYDHGIHIRKHLQTKERVTKNHYIAELAGLLFIALACPFFKKSREWREFAVSELEKEIIKQVYPDGCDYEASTTYHILVLEILFYTLIACERAEISLSETYTSQVKKMFEFIVYASKPDGTLPQIGDNDDGRFFKFTTITNFDCNYLLSLATIYFKDSHFKSTALHLTPASFWVFGKDAKPTWDSVSPRGYLPKVKSFTDAGWYVMRHSNSYCFISCGPNGQDGNGGHAHNDKLSFELMLDGHDIIVDPGTFVYTPYPDERIKFRSTAHHNTVTFNGFEQNEMSNTDAFNMTNRVTINNASLSKNDGHLVFQGEIKYLGFTHRRKIVLNKQNSACQIIDSFNSIEPVCATVHFHLSPNLTYQDGNIVMRSSGTRIASIKNTNYQLVKEEYDFSPGYGLKVKAERLRVTIPSTKEVQNVTTLIEKR